MFSCYTKAKEDEEFEKLLAEQENIQIKPDDDPYVPQKKVIGKLVEQIVHRYDENLVQNNDKTTEIITRESVSARASRWDKEINHFLDMRIFGWCI